MLCPKVRARARPAGMEGLWSVMEKAEAGRTSRGLRAASVSHTPGRAHSANASQTPGGGRWGCISLWLGGHWRKAGTIGLLDPDQRGLERLGQAAPTEEPPSAATLPEWGRRCQPTSSSSHSGQSCLSLRGCGRVAGAHRCSCGQDDGDRCDSRPSSRRGEAHVHSRACCAAPAASPWHPESHRALTGFS